MASSRRQESTAMTPSSRELANEPGLRRARFLRGLYESGRPTVALGPMAGAVAGGVPAELEQALREVDALARREAPGEAPELDLLAAAFGLERLYSASRALKERSLSAEEVAALVSVPFSGSRTAAVLWSADLALRFLPGLYELARGISREDPLVLALLQLAREWPLSSVGIALGTAELSLDEELCTHPTLRGLLVDRILERGSPELGAVPWIASALAAAVGAHPELSSASPAR